MNKVERKQSFDPVGIPSRFEGLCFFFFTLSVDRRKKKRGGGGEAEKKTEEKRSMAKETGNSPLLVFPYCPSPF